MRERDYARARVLELVRVRVRLCVRVEHAMILILILFALFQEYYKDSDEMREILVQRMRADHEYEMMKKAEARVERRQQRKERQEMRRAEREEQGGEEEGSDRDGQGGEGEDEESEDEEDEEPEFDEERARAAVCEEVPIGQKYVYGASFAYSTSLKTLEFFHAVDLNDACHLHSLTNGTMFVTLCQDADRHLVPIMETLLLDNERRETWDLHNVAITEAYTQERFDTLPRRRIIDGDKGEIASMTANTLRGNWFACQYHLGKNIATRTGRGGAVAKELYKKAVHALSIPEVCSLQRVCVCCASECASERACLCQCMC